jgi:glycosyltransferase involved in cell wall biosynthesis
MVIVDTGSRDRTIDLGRLFGARVIRFPWNGSYADARNFGLDHARGEWILSIDADEVISVQDHEHITRAVQSANRRTAFTVLTRNYSEMTNAEGWSENDGSYPAEERGTGWLPSRKVRLFRRDPRVRFQGAVHEMVEPTLRGHGVTIVPAPFVIHHYGLLDTDPVRQREKKEEYFRIGLRKVQENPDDMAGICELAVQAGELDHFEEAIGLWDRVLSRHPNYEEALFNKGYCLMRLGRYDEARDCSARALESNPTHKEAALNYGTCELYVGDPHKALSIVMPMLERHPRYPLLKGLATALLIVTSDPRGAEHLYSDLVRDGFGIDAYLRARGARLREMGRTNMAELIDGFLRGRHAG